MREVFLCLGSNIEPEKNIRFAVDELFKQFSSVKLSHVYESLAVGFEGDNFLNIVAQVNTTKPLDGLLELSDKLEQAAGRVRVKRGLYDARTLDVDIIMYDGKLLTSEDVTQHAHVLLPLVDLIGDFLHPTLGVNFKDLWDSFDDARQQVWKANLDF